MPYSLRVTPAHKNMNSLLLGHKRGHQPQKNLGSHISRSKATPEKPLLVWGLGGSRLPGGLTWGGFKLSNVSFSFHSCLSEQRKRHEWKREEGRGELDRGRGRGEGKEVRREHKVKEGKAYSVLRQQSSKTHASHRQSKLWIFNQKQRKITHFST